MFFCACAHFSMFLVILLTALVRVLSANRVEQCSVEGIGWPNRRHSIRCFWGYNIDGNGSNPLRGRGARPQGCGVPTRHTYQSLCK